MKRVIEETQEICSLCGGRGKEHDYDHSVHKPVTCRRCRGTGYVVTKRVTRIETPAAVDERLVDSASRRDPVPTAVETLQPPTYIIQLAIEASQCSPCRSKRGVAIFNRSDLVTVGYNHKPSGFECDGSTTCKATCRVEAVHAEQAALLSADWRVLGAEMLHVKTVDGALVPSGGPSCVQCSKLILAAGIEAMWLYQNDGWHRYEADEFHRLSLAATLAQQAARITVRYPRLELDD